MALIEEYPDREEMKPCPWCKKKPHEKTRTRFNSIRAGYAFICPSPWCQVRPETRFFESREAAKRAWNY